MSLSASARNMDTQNIDMQHTAMDNQEMDETFRRGRPRSETSRKAILHATRKLLTLKSLGELSIESIAKKAGVGKTTIYRWWPNKAAVALEALTEQPGLQNIIPTSASPSDAITRQLENLVRQLKGQNGKILAGIIAESQSDPETADMLYENFLKDRVTILIDNIEKGQESGELNANINPNIALDILLGPLFLRVLSGEHAMDNYFVENYPDQALMALQA